MTSQLAMVRLGLRLTMQGGRESAIRLVVTAVAIALGVGLLLITLGGINAVNSQNARYGWLATGVGPNSGGADAATAPLLWRVAADKFAGQLIGRVDVAVVGPDAPIPPGIPSLPAPGEYYASPAMARLLQQNPATALADRYPGHLVGALGDAALPSPDSLVIVVGRTAADINAPPGAIPVDRIETAGPDQCGNCPAGVGIDANGIDLILSVVAVGLMFPVVIFIGAATRLSAARREQRFAAMRLVGATPRQIGVVASVESGVAAVLGVVVGFGLFAVAAPRVASLPITDSPFFPSDISLSALDAAVVAIGIPVAAVVAARVALRRVSISPLGVSRRVTPTPPRAWRIAPLLAGLGVLIGVLVVGRPRTTPQQIQVYVCAFALITVGLAIAGPWLTMLGARLVLRHTRRAETLIAGRRLADDPKTAYRAISGLVLALFVTSVLIAAITSWVHVNRSVRGGPAAGNTLALDVHAPMPDETSAEQAPTNIDETVAELAAIPGVTGVTALRRDPAMAGPGYAPGLISCVDLAHTPALGACPPGAEVVSGDLWTSVDNQGTTPSSRYLAASGTPAAVLGTLPVQAMVVATDGSAAVERARTILEREFAGFQAPQTYGEDANDRSRLTNDYQQLVDVIILVSIPIAGCSLAVSVAGGLIERKRPFSLLRLSGAPLAVLRRVVGMETVVPLLLGAVAAISAGFFSAALFMRAQLGYRLHPPELSYYLTVGAGLLLALAVIASTFPMLSRITGPETARAE